MLRTRISSFGVYQWRFELGDIIIYPLGIRDRDYLTRTTVVIHPYLLVPSETMFTRAASVSARGPFRVVAARHISSRVPATLSKASSTLGYTAASIACLGGLAVAAQMQDSPSPVMCAKGKRFPYTGVPGTDHERSFIVSVMTFEGIEIIAALCHKDDLNSRTYAASCSSKYDVP